MLRNKKFIMMLVVLLVVTSVPVMADAVKNIEDTDRSLSSDILILKKNLENKDISTGYDDGSLKVETLIIEQKKEKSKAEVFNKDYYSENSDWELTFNELSKIDFKKINNEDDYYFARIFYEDLLEEIYIADLINKNSSLKTTIDNWKYNLQFLIDNYDEINNNNDSDMQIIDNYIEAYLVALATEEYPDEKQIDKSQIQPMSSASFKNKVVSYINSYWNRYNPEYSNCDGHGGDCANFVSQCLYAGGKPMKGTPGSASSAEDFSNWFSKGTARSTINISSTWRGANAFEWYWMDNGIGYKYFERIIGPLDYHTYADIGDAVSIVNANKVAKHTMIVYKKTISDVILAGHSGFTNDSPLDNRIDQFGGGVYIIKM